MVNKYRKLRIIHADAYKSNDIVQKIFLKLHGYDNVFLVSSGLTCISNRINDENIPMAQDDIVIFTNVSWERQAFE